MTGPAIPPLSCPTSRRVALALLAGSVLGGDQRAAVAKRHHRKYKRVTKTFNRPQPINIPSNGLASPYPSTISVSGFSNRAKITDVKVWLYGSAIPTRRISISCYKGRAGRIPCC